MLYIGRDPGQSILLEYENILEFLYYKFDHIRNIHTYQIYVNHILKLETTDEQFEFEDDGIVFGFIVRGCDDRGPKRRVIHLNCPDFVHIRRKELPPRQKIA